jgi:hypothetical protein
MNLSEFIDVTECKLVESGEHYVTFISKKTKQRCGVYVKDATSEYDAKEKAFLWLKEEVAR